MELQCIFKQSWKVYALGVATLVQFQMLPAFVTLLYLVTEPDGALFISLLLPRG